MPTLSFISLSNHCHFGIQEVVILVFFSFVSFVDCGIFSASTLRFQVIDHKLFGSRSEYDGTIDKVLEEFSVELICLAGFMRVLTSNFRRKWSGKQAVGVNSCDKYSKKIVVADYEALPFVSKPGSFNFPG